ncbi:MAG: hypothetical protein DRI61_09445 [Chloroflexi bacterium]|nr:MAG: hypothetical protein DRI61_09445 [Chloroflexota bacterium]
MADMMNDGSEWFAEQIKANCSEPVVYHRGAESVSLSATIGNTEFEVADEYNTIQTFRSRDFIITKSDLIIGGSATYPVAGDTVVEGAETFEVVSPGGSQCYREDDYGQLYRIHTKKLS